MELNVFFIFDLRCIELVDFLISNIIDILFVCGFFIIDCMWLISFVIDGLKNCFMVFILICSLFFLMYIFFIFLNIFVNVFFLIFWYSLFRFIKEIVIWIVFVLFGWRVCLVILNLWKMFRYVFVFFFWSFFMIFFFRMLLRWFLKVVLIVVLL